MVHVSMYVCIIRSMAVFDSIPVYVQSVQCCMYCMHPLQSAAICADLLRHYSANFTYLPVCVHALCITQYVNEQYFGLGRVLLVGSN